MEVMKLILILRVEKLVALQQELGINDTTMAKRIGISRPQLWRIKKYHRVGEKFVACFKNTFPQLNMDDFFIPAEEGGEMGEKKLIRN